jgi:hypothetical protein
MESDKSIFISKPEDVSMYNKLKISPLLTYKQVANMLENYTEYKNHNIDVKKVLLFIFLLIIFFYFFFNHFF